MKSNNDTIAAIATAPGAGGVGIVRVSGDAARTVLERLFCPAKETFAGFRPWMLHRGRVRDADGRMLDDALAVFMQGPKTFTGEDVAEFQCHGGPVLLSSVLEACLACGARLAEHGEFTRRAFLNGRMDLTQAEAVAEMIAAPSKEGARFAVAKLEGLLGDRISSLRAKLETLRAQVCMAVDFPEEEVDCLSPEAFLTAVDAVDKAVAALLLGFERSRCWREGVLVALAGQVNAGKSSLMNALLGRERAIVTEYAGTTRDFLEEPILLAGLPARLVDTAGLRDTDNPAEVHGIRLGRKMIASADVVLLLLDGQEGVTPETLALLEELGAQRTVLVWNKSDLASPPAHWYDWLAALPEPPAAGVVVSTHTGEGLEQLAAKTRELALFRSQGQEPEPDEAVPNLRQATCLKKVQEELRALSTDISAGVPYDLCAVRLEGAASALAEITGLDAPEEVLNRIFASFCIGK
ncbi:MAG: tRNA uridine-5-carboxymethylaminomethyl(34) synthesis GTPase MnmE [Bilophila sp.]